VNAPSPPDADLHSYADRLFAAVAAGDLETVRSCYAPDATIWHNFTNAVQDPEENLRMLGLLATWRNFRFEDVRRRVIEGGFLQQHVMRGESPEGEPFEAPSILIVMVREDLITSVEEYFDPGQLPFPS
jgi:ketosteroid isomerase-like protein